jgi:hypothetical protein
MADDALSIAKEITVAVVPKVRSIARPEITGDLAGRVFKAVLKQVLKGIKEANS